MLAVPVNPEIPNLHPVTKVMGVNFAVNESKFPLDRLSYKQILKAFGLLQIQCGDSLKRIIEKSIN